MSTFVTDGSTKKIVNLVLGAFIICCLIVPVKNAFGQAELNIAQQEQPPQLYATDDEAYSNAVVIQTKLNLEQTLKDLLLQNNVAINSCEIILSRTEQNSIIIASISIYISNDYLYFTNLISQITYDNFGVEPSIMTE